MKNLLLKMTLMLVMVMGGVQVNAQDIGVGMYEHEIVIKYYGSTFERGITGDGILYMYCETSTSLLIFYFGSGYSQPATNVIESPKSYSIFQRRIRSFNDHFAEMEDGVWKCYYGTTALKITQSYSEELGNFFVWSYWN